MTSPPAQLLENSLLGTAAKGRIVHDLHLLVVVIQPQMMKDARFFTVVLLVCALVLFLMPKHQQKRVCGGPIDHLFGDCVR
jgi:hypothetical protein